MKVLKINTSSLLYVLILLFSTTSLQAQEEKKNKDREAIKSSISSRDFEFVAEYVVPTGGSTIFLTSRYDMKVGKDSLKTALPYFGRAYVAPINPSEGGIQFTSTDFDYNVQDAKKGWNITLLPKDTKDVRQMYLSVSENGKATLQVISNNRQAISYMGYVRERSRS
jgi:hypothetical protein